MRLERRRCRRFYVAGTPVLTPTGPRPIETLKPGDWVLSRPDTCDPTQTPAR
ncbi:MAG: Hint domain-containing protein, partial [Planctomycetaceae bacterium]